MWHARFVHPRRLTASLAAGLISISVLAGCRSAPDVAAYVGDEQVTVAELDGAVDERLADEQIAGFAEGRADEFTRRVLAALVEREVHGAAAERYGVEVTDAEVQQRVEQLLQGDDPDAVYEQLAQQGIGRADVAETIRQQLLRRELAAGQGDAAALEEDALRARYDEVREALAQVEFGYLTVPDQATADAVVAGLTGAPARYGEFAAQYPGTYTLAQLDRRVAGELPPPLAQGLETAAPGTAFSVAVPETGGIVVAFRAGTVYPTFEEARPQLEEEAAGEIDAAGAALVDTVREDLDVTVNPRYGQLKDGQVVPAEGGVVDLLEDAADPQDPDALGSGPAD